MAPVPSDRDTIRMASVRSRFYGRLDRTDDDLSGLDFANSCGAIPPDSRRVGDCGRSYIRCDAAHLPKLDMVHTRSARSRGTGSPHWNLEHPHSSEIAGLACAALTPNERCS
jgi:hypothetical protein